MLLRAAVCLAGCLTFGVAGEWPQWRGPNRDGVANPPAAPKVWPEELKLKWKVKVGEGHSSPVVAGGRVYLHSRQGDREVVSCLRPDTGQAVWQQSYAAPYSVNFAAFRHGKGVKSTPVVEGGRIYTLGIGGILSCFDAATGKPQWRREFTAPDFGTAMSPLVERGMVIAHAGLKGGGALTAFDAQTGQEKWSWKGDGPSYTSPIVVELAGTRQVVTQTRRKIVSVSPATGQLLWEMPYTTAYDQNVVTPVVYRDLLIFSGLRNGVVAVRVSKRGGAFSTEKVWENKNLSMYMSSPVVSGELMFGLTTRNSGQFFCLDPRTGGELWASEGRRGDNAAIVDAGSALLFLTTEAELSVVHKTGKAFERVRKYTVADSPTWAHVVPVDGGILIKDATTLALWELP